MHLLEDTISRFGVDPSHTLKQQNSDQHEKDKTLYEVCWFIEKNANDEIVARYRCWANHTKTAPYRSQIGWERYSPSGSLLDREVHYATLDDSTTLH